MKRYFKTAINITLTVAIMLLIAQLGAFAAGGIKIGGKALIDIIPVERIKTAAGSIGDPQTINIISKYSRTVTDKAFRLEYGAYYHISVLYNLIAGAKDKANIDALAIENEMLIIYGKSPDEAAAKSFEGSLLKRGFFISRTKYTASGDEKMAFIIAVDTSRSELRIP